ncbi:MAG: hypothetical protein AAGI23_14735 [Bacteroidota bacterium]
MDIAFVSPRVGTGKADGLFILIPIAIGSPKTNLPFRHPPPK